MRTPPVEELARELGMKPSEIDDVADEEVGLIVRGTDGTQLVKVPDQRPDAEGKTGWMLLVAPALKADQAYAGEFPLYAQPQEDVPDVDPADGDYPAKGNADAVLAWVAGDEARAREALDLEQAKDKPRKGLVTELEGILAQYAAAGSDDGAVDAGDAQ